MILPDPDDPHWKAEAKLTGIYLACAIAFLVGFACLVIGFLGH